MKALLAIALLAAPPAPSPSPTAMPRPDLSSRIIEASNGARNVPAGLAGVRLSWHVADFIAEHASKEDSESLGADVRGFRRFRVLPAARPKELDDVVVYFRDNRVMLIAATETRSLDDAGSWSRLVAQIAATLGPGASGSVPADRAKMLLSFSLGEKGKALKMREFVAWDGPTGEIGALWLEDSWAKKRIYVLTLARSSTPAGPVVRRDAPALGGLFVAEKAFFAEFDVYSSDLRSLGFRRPKFDEPGAGWVYGFCNEHPVGAIPGQPEHDGKRNHTLHPGLEMFSGGEDPLAPLANPCAILKTLGLADRFQVTPHGFTAFAMGNFDADDDVEVWSIDQFKNLERLRSDSP